MIAASSLLSGLAGRIDRTFPGVPFQGSHDLNGPVSDRVDLAAGIVSPGPKCLPVDSTPFVASAAVPGPPGAGLRLILAGPPGAGKSTHAARLAEAYNVPAISMGSLLRQEMQEGTLLGQQAEPYVKRGDLVPIEIVSEVLAKRLAKPDASRGFLLDGLPRRLEDVELLQRLTRKTGIGPIPMLLLDVPDREIVGRVENRRMCERGHLVDIRAYPPRKPGVCDEDGSSLTRRKDDDSEVVRHRLDVYHRETQPVVQYYRDHGLLYVVDGLGTIEEVDSRVQRIAGLLAAPAPTEMLRSGSTEPPVVSVRSVVNPSTMSTQTNLQSNAPGLAVQPLDSLLTPQSAHTEDT